MDMKVAISTWEVPPMNSGPSYSMKGLIEGLADRIEVVILAPKFAVLKQKPKLEVHTFNTIDLPIVRVCFFALKANLFVRKLKVDLIHDNGILGFTRFSPFIETWRHSDVDVSDTEKVGVFSRYRELLTIRGIKRADYIIAISSFAADDLVDKYSIPYSRIEVIPVGVETGFFKPCRTESCNSLECVSGEVNLLYVGALIGRKNVSSLIFALKYVLDDGIDAHLSIVGEGPQRKYLQNLSKALKLDDRVTFYGEVSRDTLLHLYNVCDLLVQSSFKEGFGRTLIEALSCETPVITTPTGIHEIIKKNSLGVVADDFTPLGLASAMKIALANKFSNLRKFVVENFDWDRVVEKTLRFYSRVLDEC